MANRRHGISAEELAKQDAEIVRLFNAEGAEHVTMTELARRYRISLPTVSRIVNRALGEPWAQPPSERWK